jgi:DNA-binding response OmpR family regulator
MASVMIAEDDLLVADMLEETLIKGGYDVCGIARTVDKAVELGERHRPDLAILDIRLADGGLGTEILPRLTSAGNMGVLYASGYVLPSMTKADGAAVIKKPYHPDEVLRALKIVEQIVLTGNAPRPFMVWENSGRTV